MEDLLTLKDPFEDVGQTEQSAHPRGATVQRKLTSRRACSVLGLSICLISYRIIVRAQGFIAAHPVMSCKR